MSELPPPRFRKTKNGTWAVMGPVETLEAALSGDGKVEVVKRSGDTSSFTVKSLGKPFDVDGVQMCYGYPDEDDGAGQGGGSAGGSAGGGSASGGAGGASRRPASGPSSAPAPRGPAAAREALAKVTAPEPDRDLSEPLPEFQGGVEDEWHGDF